jgi:hypothetical protein
MKVTKATIKRLYVDAIMKYQHAEDEKQVRKDVHTGAHSPGPGSFLALLEIYCESGIMNASDIHEHPPMPEFDYKGGCSYNSDMWVNMDEYVNLMLEAQGCSRKVYTEAINGAVVAVYWS